MPSAVERGDAELRAATVGARSTSPTGARTTDVRDAWAGDDQRHPQRRVVDEQAVADLAVLAERLAVIGGDDDQRGRRVGPSASITRPDLPIRFRDLVVVRAARPGGRSDGSPYGACGSNRWTQRKKRSGAMLGQPRDRLVHDDAAGPFVGGPPVARRAACDRRRSGSPGSGRSGGRAERRRRTRPVAKPLA